LWNYKASPVNPHDTSQTVFVVRNGAGIKEIAQNLKDADLIRDPFVFYLIVKLHHLGTKIQHGNFLLSRSMNTQGIAEGLTHGSYDIRVTIPEGKRAEEIADILKANIPSYNESWRATLISHEGYLFPDTYLIAPDATIDIILSQMQKNFDAKYTEALAGVQSNFTQQQIIILASLIEREARTDEERPLIASVLENRLSVPMRLQVDATVQYALGYDTIEQTWWKKNLTLEDLQFRSPYNTYTNDGIPPGPICNPGIAAIKAAAQPAKTNYLFYVTDKTGITHFAKTHEEHDQNIRKYGI